MKNKLLIMLALALCVSAFFLPATAYAEASADRTPPTVSAWINGDILHIEASDDISGVEAVYVNGHRFNYFVDGAIDVPLREYAGTDETISVHAVDFAGNKSKTITVKNPYCIASTPSPTPAPAITPAVPSPTPVAPQPSNTPRPSPQLTATPSPSPTAPPEPSSEPTEADPDDLRPFTPNGTGTLMDNATDGDGKEFFTITTESESVFYLIVDRQRDNKNVYLLNTVTEDDLMALAQKNNKAPSESVIPSPQPEPQPTMEPTPTPEPEQMPASGGNNTGAIIFIILAAFAVGGVGYYFKILKPRRDGAQTDDDELDTEDMEYGEDIEDNEYLSDEDEFFTDADADTENETDPGNEE